MALRERPNDANPAELKPKHKSLFLQLLAHRCKESPLTKTGETYRRSVTGDQL